MKEGEMRGKRELKSVKERLNEMSGQGRKRRERDEVYSNQRRLCSAFSLPTPFHHTLTTQLVFLLRLSPHLTSSHIKHPIQAPLPCRPPSPSPPLALPPSFSQLLHPPPSPSLIPFPSHPSSLISFIPAFLSSPSPIN